MSPCAASLLANIASAIFQMPDDVLLFSCRYRQEMMTRHHIVPFIITDALKAFYYRGLANWPHLPGYLRDTCLTAQDNFKIWLGKFGIEII